MTTISLFLASLAIFQQSGNLNSQKITFSQPAMTLGRLLPKLGEAAGVKMEADKSIKNEVVLIRVKDMPLKDLLAKVANVSSGEWKTDGDNYRLQLSPQKANAERAQDIADTKASVEASRAFYSQFGSSSPTGQEAADAIAKLIPISDLALLEPGETVVYALPPNRSQRSLPRVAWNLAQEYILANPYMTKGELAKIIVRATCQQRHAFGFQLRFARSDGRCIGRTASGWSAIPLDPGNCEIEWPNPDAPIRLAQENQAACSRVRSALLKLSSYRAGQPIRNQFGGIRWMSYMASDPDEGKSLMPSLRQVFLNPAQYDPLNFGPADSLACLADTQDMSIVACIPDSALIPAQEVAENKTTARELPLTLRFLWDMELIVEGSCISSWPRYRHEARQDRIDRSALTSLLSILAKEKQPRIDSWIDYFAAQPNCPWSRTFEHIWLQIVSPDNLFDLEDSNRMAFKFLGLLGKGVRKALIDGTRMPLNAIPVKAKDYLLKFADAFDIQSQKAYDKDPKTGEWIIYTIDDNLTEVAPNMPALNGTLALTKSERTILYGDDGKGHFFGLDHKASDIPVSVVASEHVVISHPRIEFPWYVQGKRTVYYLSIDFAIDPNKLKQFSLTYPFFEDSVPFDSSRIALKDTPQDFQDWMRRNNENIERQRAANNVSGRPITP